MLHHILVKWNEQVDDKASLLPGIDTLFQGVLNVPGVHGVTLHPNVIDRPNRYDPLIRIEMDESALPAYDTCEAHHAWKARYGHLISKKAIFDCN
ncbi:MAG: hypothetical protein IJZ74_09730 [Clostridia bacterium]|nr:hypothetical protein [Clostridia bacterium]